MSRHSLSEERLEQLLEYSSEPLMPVPAPELYEEVQRWVPTCPTCNGAMRRDRSEPLTELRCDLHGKVEPLWVEVER